MSGLCCACVSRGLLALMNGGSIRSLAVCAGVLCNRDAQLPRCVEPYVIFIPFAVAAASSTPIIIASSSFQWFALTGHLARRPRSPSNPWLPGRVSCTAALRPVGICCWPQW